MPRLVLLEHRLPDSSEDPRSDHWDLMLEVDDSSPLLTWSIQEFPKANRSILATRLDDHRRKYLDYEGPVSNNRGSVRLVFACDFEWVQQQPQHLILALNSERFSKLEIIHASDVKDPDQCEWSICFSSLTQLKSGPKTD